MTTTTKLIVLGAGFAAIVLAIRRWATAGALARLAPELRAGDLAAMRAGAVPAGAGAPDSIAVPRGLSDVDPAPLAHLTEAMDPEANRAAHSDVTAQRDRLPVRGRHLP